jgi:N-acetylmuramoyl-L-alanine amidase
VSVRGVLPGAWPVATPCLSLLAAALLVSCGVREGMQSPGEVPEPAVTAEPEVTPQVALAPIERSWRRVVIDAGHGGDDTGAVGVSGVAEKDITLSIALATARSLRSRGFEVVLTREEDVFLPLARRSGMTDASGAGLFVSIHANAAPSAQARGVETYSMDVASDEAAERLAERENRAASIAGADFEEEVDAIVSELRLGAAARRSAELASTVHASLIDGLQGFYGADRIRDRSARTGPFWVLVDTRVPAVLVEVGYLTHATEERRLRTRGFHHQVAEALASAIEDFANRAEAVDPAAPEPVGPMVGGGDG